MVKSYEIAELLWVAMVQNQYLYTKGEEFKDASPIDQARFISIAELVQDLVYPDPQ